MRVDNLYGNNTDTNRSKPRRKIPCQSWERHWITLGRQNHRLLWDGLTLEFVDEFLNPEDMAFESHGVKVIVDPKSLAYIDGTELDFTKEGLQ